MRATSLHAPHSPSFRRQLAADGGGNLHRFARVETHAAFFFIFFIIISLSLWRESCVRVSSSALNVHFGEGGEVSVHARASQ